MPKHILFTLLLLSIIWLSLSLSFKMQEDQQAQIQRIEHYVQNQDSLITTLLGTNSRLEQTIHKQDSLLQDQQQVIWGYERAVDSLSVIMRFLQRSDLSRRYGTKQPR